LTFVLVSLSGKVYASIRISLMLLTLPVFLFCLNYHSQCSEMVLSLYCVITVILLSVWLCQSGLVISLLNLIFYPFRTQPVLLSIPVQYVMLKLGALRLLLLDGMFNYPA
jgi:hypothetical protein